MGVVARMKSMVGWSPAYPIPTLASATTLVLQANHNRYILTGTTTIVTISATRHPGRQVTFFRGPSGSDLPVFTNTQGTTTEGQIDMNSNVATFQLFDALTLIQMNDGSWRKEDDTTV